MKTRGPDKIDSELVVLHGSRRITHRITRTRSKIANMDCLINTCSKRDELGASGMKGGD
jgi:hypothetical protein